MATTSATAKTITLLRGILAGEAAPVEAVVTRSRGLVGLEVTKVVTRGLLGGTLLRNVGRALERVGIKETLESC